MKHCLIIGAMMGNLSIDHAHAAQTKMDLSKMTNEADFALAQFEDIDKSMPIE